MAAATVVLIAGIPRIELTDNWTQYLDERYEFRRDTDFVVENLTGMENLEYSLSAGREGGIADPGYLHKIDAFAEWYRAQPEVLHVQAFSDIMKRLNKNMHGDDPAFYRLPEDSELAAQYLLLYELSVPFGRDLNNRIDVGKSQTRMTVTMLSLHTQAQRELDARGQDWLHANAPDLATEASGISLVFAHLNTRNSKSMLWGTITAMALISFLLIWIFRSVRLGLVSLVPNFIPSAMAFGVWGYLYRPGGERRISRDRDRLRHRRRRHDSFHEQVSEGASRRPFRVRGGALCLSFGRSTAVYHDHDPGAGLPGIRYVGIRDQLDARPPGCAHDRLRAALRFPAPPALADSHRPEDPMMSARLARSVHGAFAPARRSLPATYPP